MKAADRERERDMQSKESENSYKMGDEMLSWYVVLIRDFTTCRTYLLITRDPFVSNISFRDLDFDRFNRIAKHVTNPTGRDQKSLLPK